MNAKISVPGIGSVAFAAGRSRRRSNSRRFRATANTNAKIAEHLHNRVQQLEKELKVERQRNLRGNYPGLTLNNYNFGTQVRGFADGFLGDPTGLLQRNTLGAASSLLQSGGGGYGLSQASRFFSQSPAFHGSAAGRFNLFQMIAYQQSRSLLM